MKITDNDMDKIGKVLLVIFAFMMLMFSIETKAQGYTVTKIEGNYEINFLDEFADQWYLDGEPIAVYGKLNLNEKEYKQLIKDIKRTLKQISTELIRPSYEVLKYSWVKDSVWVYKNEKAFSVTKKDLEYLNSKL
tara:strand:- start:17 stop:421 length:405 start_codon:yes stop_codon:yes gene_type:complete